MISSVLSLFCLAQLVVDKNKKLFISDRFGYGILCCSSDMKTMILILTRTISYATCSLMKMMTTGRESMTYRCEIKGRVDNCNHVPLPFLSSFGAWSCSS